jgi:hypothetical protein
MALALLASEAWDARTEVAKVRLRRGEARIRRAAVGPPQVSLMASLQGLLHQTASHPCFHSEDLSILSGNLINYFLDPVVRHIYFVSRLLPLANSLRSSTVFELITTYRQICP